MSYLELAMWIGLVLLGFVGSALYSGLETGVYTLNRVRLHILDHKNIRSAQNLRRMLDDPTNLLSTLLIGNNLTNQIGTAGLAVILASAGWNPWQTIFLNTVLVAPLLFVFGETLPKDLFAAHADKLMYRLTTTLWLSGKLFTWTGVVPLVGGFTWLLTRISGGNSEFHATHPRRQVEFLVKEGVGHGLLSDDQTAIIQRVLALGDRSVGDEAVPWNKVVTVGADDKPAQLWELAEQTRRSHFPVIDSQGKVVGMLNLVDALMHRPQTCPPLRQLMEPTFHLKASCPLREGLLALQTQSSPLAIVTDEHDKPVGVASIKDLVEPITGELSNW